MPADVDRYVKEMQEKDPSMPDDKAWAIAWSRYCKYKNPGSSHCKQDEYFTGQGKSGSYSFRIATKNLPDVLKTVLKSLRIQIPREISIYPRVMDDLYSAGNDGCRGFAIVVNLRSKLTDEYWGAFGGGGLGKVLLVDDLNQSKFPLDNDTVILKGERGSTSSVFLCCNPDVAEVFRGRGLEKMSSLTYSKFKDAAEIDPRYGSGKTQIWYCQRKFSRELSVGSSLALKRGLMPDPFALENTHVYIGNVNETNPNKVFYMMQGEVWSPEGEARGLMSIQSCGHTSMSVGDVMVINGEAFMVDMNGFFDLMKAQPRTASASRVAAQKAKKDVAKGKLPPPNKFPAAKGLKDMSGGGKHHTRTKDVAKGQSRKEKHKKNPMDKEASAKMHPALEEEVWAAGYDAASDMMARGKNFFDSEGLFVQSIGKYKCLPKGLNEDHPLFYEYVEAFTDGAKSYSRNYPKIHITGSSPLRLQRDYGSTEFGEE